MDMIREVEVDFIRLGERKVEVTVFREGERGRE